MKDIKGYETQYSVTESGLVFNKKINKIISICITGRGYNAVTLNKKMHLLHRLVAIHFVPNPENKPQVNHKDGNKLNNHKDNLEWCTGSENMIHAYKTGLQTPSEKQKKATSAHNKKNYSKRVIQKNVNGDIIAEYESASEAARQTGFCQTHISSVCRGKVKLCHTFKFEYAN